MTDEYLTTFRDKYQFWVHMKGNGMLQNISIILRQLYHFICIGRTVLYLSDQLGKYKGKHIHLHCKDHTLGLGVVGMVRDPQE